MKDPDYAYISKLVMACWNDASDAFAELYALTYNKLNFPTPISGENA